MTALTIKSRSTPNSSVLHEQKRKIFLHDLFVLDQRKREEDLLGLFDLAERCSAVERWGEVVVGEVAVLLELTELVGDFHKSGDEVLGVRLRMGTLGCRERDSRWFA